MAEQEQEQTILKLIASNGFISYNKIIARTFGVHEAIVLGELCSICSYFNYKEFYINQERISNDTALSVKQIRTALTNLVNSKIIEVTKKGLPCKNWYTINGELLNSLLGKDNKNDEKKSESNQKGEQDVPKVPNEIGKNSTSGCEEKSQLLSNKNTGIIIQNNNTPSEDSSLHSESSCEEPNGTDEKETQTDTLITKNKMSEQSDKADRPEEKETGKNSDSQNPADGLAPWEKPAKKSKPKVPLPDREPVNVEAIVLKDGREWLPDGYFLQEMIRLHPQLDVKAEFMAMRGWSISNPTKRKTWGGIKRFVSGWLDRAQNKPRGNGNYSSFPQKHKEAFVDGKRDYSDTDW